MGVSFILLAGGEPLMRLMCLKWRGGEKNILFPVFTNGTMISKEILSGSRNAEPDSGEPQTGSEDVDTYLQMFMDNRISCRSSALRVTGR